MLQLTECDGGCGHLMGNGEPTCGRCLRGRLDRMRGYVERAAEVLAESEPPSGLSFDAEDEWVEGRDGLVTEMRKELGQ